MKSITFSLPNKIVKALAKLKETGLYPSRSEILRIALWDFFKGGGSLLVEPEVKSQHAKVKTEEEKHEIVCVSLPQHMIYKLDECVMLNEHSDNRSRFMFNILKSWLPDTFKLVASLLEKNPIVVKRSKRFPKRTEIDLRKPAHVQMISELISRLNF